MHPDHFPNAKSTGRRATGRGLRVLLSESSAPRITDSEVGNGMAIGSLMQTSPLVIELGRVSAQGVGSLDAIEDHLARVQRRAQS